MTKQIEEQFKVLQVYIENIPHKFAKGIELWIQQTKKVIIDSEGPMAKTLVKENQFVKSTDSVWGTATDPK